VVREGQTPFDALPSGVLDWWSETTSTDHPEGGHELVPEVLVRRFPLGGASTLMVRRETAEALGGFDPEFPRHQDWEFLVRLLKTGKIAYVDGTLVTKHDTGRPSSDDVDRAKELFLSRFSSDVAAAERAGYDVTGVQQFDKARLHFINGEFAQGLGALSGAKIRVPELLRVVAIGAHASITGGPGG